MPDGSRPSWECHSRNLICCSQVEKAHPKIERDKISKRSRKRAIGFERRFAFDLLNRVMLLLLYYLRAKVMSLTRRHRL